jgi:hypothetical protein
MEVREYYREFFVDNKIRIVFVWRAELSIHLFMDFLGSFCISIKRCRSPPFINLILKKIQIDRRKERWQNAQKEENIRITLIH